MLQDGPKQFINL